MNNEKKTEKPKAQATLERLYTEIDSSMVEKNLVEYWVKNIIL
jgi:hypothetical protein